MQVGLVRMGGQVVLRLAVTLAPGKHRLARRLESLERGTDLAQRCRAGASHLVEHEHCARDLRVFGCGVERLEDVP